MCVEAVRGGIVESVHRVSVAVVDAGGRLVARSGDPDFVTFLRSAAKPFQALPLVEDGAAEHGGISIELGRVALALFVEEGFEVGALVAAGQIFQGIPRGLAKPSGRLRSARRKAHDLA